MRTNLVPCLRIRVTAQLCRAEIPRRGVKLSIVGLSCSTYSSGAQAPLPKGGVRGRCTTGKQLRIIVPSRRNLGIATGLDPCVVHDRLIVLVSYPPLVACRASGGDARCSPGKMCITRGASHESQLHVHSAQPIKIRRDARRVHHRQRRIGSGNVLRVDSLRGMAASLSELRGRVPSVSTGHDARLSAAGA